MFHYITELSAEAKARRLVGNPNYSYSIDTLTYGGKFCNVMEHKFPPSEDGFKVCDVCGLHIKGNFMPLEVNDE